MSKTYNLKNGQTVEVIIEENDYNLNVNDLFSLATRENNTKRGFLFVNKLLGKHISSRPENILNLSAILAYKAFGMDVKNALKAFSSSNKYFYVTALDSIPVKRNTLVIGFAETATAMGHSIYSILEDSCIHIHTTREVIEGIHTINFEEEHSHASSHKLYSDCMSLQEAEEVILVDDELTTGKTAINMINNLVLSHGKKDFKILTYLDWRTEEDCNKLDELAKRHGIKIEVVSLIKGRINVTGEIKNTDKVECKVEYLFIEDNELERIVCKDSGKTYLHDSGVIERSKKDLSSRKLMSILNKNVYKIQDKCKGKTLCLGTEEFMYIPLVISSMLEGDIQFQSTTRSPIVEDNEVITDKCEINSVYNYSVKNFVYNITKDTYDTVLIFLETVVDQYKVEKLTKALENKGVKNIVYIVL